MEESQNSENNFLEKNQKCFISWNSRGIKNKKEDLEILTKELNPFCICNQETKLKIDQSFSLKNYIFEHKPQILHQDEIAKGGVGMFIRNDVSYSEINLQTIFQAIAFQIFIHIKLTICSIYIHDSINFSERDLENLIEQLPKPFILVGDFNSHNTLWFDKKTDKRGKILENFILKNDICFLDGEKFTYSKGTTQSHIDLTLISPEIFPLFEWDTYDSLCNSDHVPIIIKTKSKFENEIRQKWNMSKANWDKFKKLAIFDKPFDQFNDINNLCDYIVNTLINAARKSIPFTKYMKGKASVPWWNGSCRVAVKNKKRAYKKYLNNPTSENFIFYKKCNAEAKKIVRQSKKESWIKFLAGINSCTPIKEVWSRVSKLRKNKMSNVTLLNYENKIINKPEEIANILVKSMSNVSSFKNRSENFIRHKNNIQKVFDFNTNENKEYNSPITVKEILFTLKNLRDTATGDDQIHYFMIKNLSLQSLEYLKKFYNIIFLKKLFPENWREAMIIPVLKPDKNATDPLSYRPISLISCLCKILDKIINKRLVWFIEKNNLIRHYQSGSREGRNTLDNLGEIVTEIQHAFAHQKYHVSLFLDLEKAYDTCWNQHLLQQLENFGMSGSLPIFIQNFLENRSIFIKLGNIKSDLSRVDLGIPQGSSLSGTLFIIAIDSVLKNVSNYIGKSLFVDDLRLSVTENKLQTGLGYSPLAEW